MESKKLIESKNMFSVVQGIEAGYNKYFDSKPKTSGTRSQCYNNYKTCGASSENVQKNAVNQNEMTNSKDDSAPENHSQKTLIQEFFPEPEVATKQSINKGACSKYTSVKQDDTKELVNGSGCRKNLCMKRKE